MPRSRRQSWLTCGFRAERALAGDRPPRYGCQGRLPFTVGRGPVPRRASVEEATLASVRFSRRASTRGGLAPALRLSRPSPFHRRARACPSPCLGRGNSFGVRAVFAQSERSRGTGPRATGQKVLVTGGRGPVPRHPSRYEKNVSCSLRS